MIIDAPVLTQPRAWRVTKINRISPNGLVRVTLAQTEFNAHTDYIETNEDGNVIGMWANFFDNVTPQDPPDTESDITSTISFSGLKPELKVGGSYKKLTITFSDDESHDGEWSYEIDGESAIDLLTILTSSDSSDVNDNQIKIKFIGDDTYIGKVLTVKYTSDEITSTIRLGIVGL